mmetsp:Transcript_47062/g.125946  ORF Transcript_47062/g.125946 Transcript_47062/m.125946 type:complete len:296 (-) Transcript_47062:98-985(-)
MWSASGSTSSSSRPWSWQKRRAKSKQSSPSLNSMYLTPVSVSTSKTIFGRRSRRSSSRSSTAHWWRTSASESSFSCCSWSTISAEQVLSFSISRSFFWRARTLRRTASLSPRSMTFGLGPCRFGAAGSGASPGLLLRVEARSLCCIRSANGCARGMSMLWSRMKRRATSRQLPPARISSRWLPQAEVISKTRASGCSSISSCLSSFARELLSSPSWFAFSRCCWSSASRPRHFSRSMLFRRPWSARTRRRTASRSQSSTSRIAAPASVPSRISSGGGGKSGGGAPPRGRGRQSDA